MAEAEFRYADLLPAGADDTPYRLDLVAQGAQDPAVRLWVRLLVAGFGGIEEIAKYETIHQTRPSMGQWNLLHKRFAYFSQGGRTVLFCTNNTHTSWGTALCIYQDGEQKLMGNFADSAEGLWTHTADGWRLAMVDVN